MRFKLACLAERCAGTWLLTKLLQSCPLDKYNVKRCKEGLARFYSENSG